MHDDLQHHAGNAAGEPLGDRQPGVVVADADDHAVDPAVVPPGGDQIGATNDRHPQHCARHRASRAVVNDGNHLERRTRLRRIDDDHHPTHAATVEHRGEPSTQTGSWVHLAEPIERCPWNADRAAQTEPQRHFGWGVSVDQRVGDGLTLFGRFGNQAKGSVAFDRALTLGAEANGSYWSRGGDSLGLALGWLRTSAAYRDHQSAAGVRAGAERVAELYYRFRVGKQFELSPSLQWLSSPGGDADARSQRVLGLRSQFTF